MSTPLETRLSVLAPLMAEPAAPGADPAGGKNQQTVSLLYPTPDIAADTRKWDIAQKNLLSELDSLREDESGEGTRGMNGRALDRLRDWVAKAESDTLPEGGFALFARGDELAVQGLGLRPHPTLHVGQLFALPALVDAARQLDYWCVVLDIERPHLFRVSGGQWTDKTPKGLVGLSGEMGQYEPMASVTFHSSGRPHIGSAAHASAKFHALGVSTTDLKAEEIERVLTNLAREVGDATHGSSLPVLLAGDPKRCGLFRAHFDHQHLVEPDLHVAGDALELRGLAGRAREAMATFDAQRRAHVVQNLDRHTVVSNTDQLLTAAREGRIAAVYLREDMAGMLEGDDERLKLNAVDDRGAEARSMIVTEAVKNGASLNLFAEDMADDLPPLGATMRY